MHSLFVQIRRTEYSAEQTAVAVMHVAYFGLLFLYRQADEAEAS